MKEFNLELYLTNGVENIVRGILRTSLRNPDASQFVFQYAKANKKAAALRDEAEKDGRHIPPFLIASISNQCNLHCQGCYARANKTCQDGDDRNSSKLLSAAQWADIFNQAVELGISFILLAGGEPFVRQDILKAAAKQKKIMFPVFTNGTMINEEYLELLLHARNLVPILSMEGSEEVTDKRRGKGVFQRLREAMYSLHKKGILFGVSITVQKENIDEVMSGEFLQFLKNEGCGGVIFVEYVPMGNADSVLALDEIDRERMMRRLKCLREREQEMVFLAFPGDEKTSGGCLAAGRGFFHINPYGGAEPCPFSPYSDTNLTNTPLKEALESPLFLRLKREGVLMAEHVGGCVLHEREAQVKALLRGGKQ